MVNMVESVSSSYPAVAETVPRTRRRLAGIAACAGATAEQLDRVRLAVSEAVTNAVEHAYDDGEGLVHVSAVAAGGHLLVLVADDGRGLTGSRNREGLGLGLSVAARMSDGFELAKRSCGGVEVQMQFNLGARIAAPEGVCAGSVLAHGPIAR